MQRRKIIFPTISEVMNEFMGKKNMSVENIRDLIIMEGLSHDKDYETINEALKEKSMPDLNIRM